MDQALNNGLVLICGYSSTGKTASLRNIRNQEKWMYLGCEAGKSIPFKNKFKSFAITDPYQVYEAFDYAIEHENEIDGIIIDSLSFLMDMFESQYVIGASNTMRAWGDYQQFFKNLMQSKVAKFGKPTLILAHVKDVLDEKNMEMKTMVPIKGALANQGCEAYFNVVIAAKRMTLKELEPYKSDLLHITEDEEDLGFKYCFQTRLTAKTTGERIRGPMGLFKKNETFMDNDCQILLDHIYKFYEE